MKDLMERILTIDHTANNRLNEAIRKKEEMIAEINERKRKLSQEIEDYANNHLASFEESEKLSSQDSMLAIKNSADTEQARLQKIYDDNHAQWVETIVSNILAQ